MFRQVGILQVLQILQIPTLRTLRILFGGFTNSQIHDFENVTEIWSKLSFALLLGLDISFLITGFGISNKAKYDLAYIGRL